MPDVYFYHGLTYHNDKCRDVYCGCVVFHCMVLLFPVLDVLCLVSKFSSRKTFVSCKYV